MIDWFVKADQFKHRFAIKWNWKSIFDLVFALPQCVFRLCYVDFTLLNEQFCLMNLYTWKVWEVFKILSCKRIGKKIQTVYAYPLKKQHYVMSLHLNPHEFVSYSYIVDGDY